MRVTVLLTLSLLLTVGLWGAPRAEYWSVWDRSNPDDRRGVDHSAFASILDRYLVADDPSGINLFRYESVGAADRRKLKEYIAALEATPIREYNRAEQMAFWINLYNAATIDLVLDRYPVESIRRIDISPGLFASGPWDGELVTVEGIPLTLNNIEHRILRPLWRDARIHYAVNCASMSCPNLAPEPYAAADLEAQLDRAASDYIAHPRGVRIEGNNLTLSSIYDWYGEDFGGGVEGVLEHLRRYAGPQLASDLENWNGRIRYGYDWSLNEPR